MTPEMLTGMCVAKFAAAHQALCDLDALLPEAVTNGMTSPGRLEEVLAHLDDAHAALNLAHAKARWIAEDNGITPSAGGVRPPSQQPTAP